MVKRKKILLIGNFLGKDANPSPTQELKMFLQKHRHKIYHCRLFPKNRYLRIMARILHLFLFARSVDFVFIDVYSGAAFSWAEQSGSICRRFGKPYICILHGGNLPQFSSRNRERVEKLLFGAYQIVCVSSYLREKLKMLDFEMNLIPNAIHLEYYHCSIRKQRLPKILWLRAFHKVYNPQMALHMLAQLLKKHPDVSLTMAGPDKGELAACKKLARELRILEHVNFPGKLAKDQIYTMAENHHFFINTSNVDNTPISVIEAMACGMVIISTRVGGIPYLLKDGEDSVLVEIGNYREMAQQVDYLLQNGEKAEFLARKARHRAELFDWQKTIVQWQQLII